MQESGLDPKELRAKVIEPALGILGLPGGEAAIRLVLGTGAQESGLRHLMQQKGPAISLWQIQKATYSDLFTNFLSNPKRIQLRTRLTDLAARMPSIDVQLASNLCLGAAVCRLIYFRAPDPLPEADDIDGLGKYWKRFYNTAGGAGNVAEFVANYRSFIGG